MVEQPNIYVFGAGGHAKVVADMIEQQNKFHIAALVVPDGTPLATWSAYPCILESEVWKNPNTTLGIVAVGDNAVRARVVASIRNHLPNFHFVTICHPSAIIASTVTVGAGTVIMAGAVVQPYTTIGQHCIINTQASVDHECWLDDYASIAPSACLGGNVHIGSHTYIALGANLIHGISIGAHSVIGAGATVVTSIGTNVVAYGTPAKIVRHRDLGDAYL